MNISTGDIPPGRSCRPCAAWGCSITRPGRYRATWRAADRRGFVGHLAGRSRSGPICVKRALAKLRVDADWRAPVERNIYEARWMRVAGQAAPSAVPTLLGQDAAAGMLAMSYLPPQITRCGRACCATASPTRDFAASVGRDARAHPRRHRRRSVAGRGVSDRYDILRHPAGAVSDRDGTRASRPGRPAGPAGRRDAREQAGAGAWRRQPKEHPDGPDGPVFLDAECAWWGDPAFDLAFCLNHLLLKCLWVPGARAASWPASSHGRDLSGAGQLGGRGDPRGAGGRFVARAAAGPRRWQVARRVYHRRNCPRRCPPCREVSSAKHSRASGRRRHGMGKPAPP